MNNSEHILKTALQFVRQRFGFDVAFVSEFKDGRRFFRHVDAKHGLETAAIRSRSDPLEATYCQRIVDGRLPPVIPDTSQNPEAARLGATEELDIRSHVGAPVRFSDGRVYGTLCCYSHAAAAALSDAQMEAVRLLADFLSVLLDQERSSRELAESALQRISAVLEDHQFYPVYQPIVHVQEHRIVGYEALTRFTAEPLRSPDKWFAEAGAAGLQVQLEIACAKRALQALPVLPAGAYVSINVSPATVLSGALTQVVAGYSLERIMIEITEHALIENYDDLAAALNPLRALGLRLAVDDAGAGFASFRHILLLRPDVIKIDGSLVQHIHHDRSCRALAAAIINFAAETGSKIVAEGVETVQQLEQLRALRVNKAQGYLLGKPQPLSTLQHALSEL